MFVSPSSGVTMEKRQIELDRAHGSGAWGMVRPGEAELHSLIRKFYESEYRQANSSQPEPLLHRPDRS